ARVAPLLLTILRPIVVWLTVVASRRVRDNTRCNAKRIIGRALSDREARAFARGVIRSFYDFVTDVGRNSRGRTPQDFLRRLESDPGRAGYLKLREQRRGCVLVTAHMGEFEVG